MCGLNGIFKYSNIDESDIKNIENMNTCLFHRGPDGNGIFYDDKCILGQVRLSIVGVSNGKQPIYNEDKSLVIICNGEIYNYEILKKELIKKGYTFTTESDTEVILHLFEEKGEKMLEDLIGMFAIAIYNTKTKKLFLARDICGEKPLYYANTPHGFVFSSQMDTISQFYLSTPKIDWHELHNFIDHSFSQTLDKTFIQQIKRLEPGTYCYIDDKDIVFQRYWKRTNTYSYKKSYEEAKKECLDIIRESIKMTIPKEVPVAVLLSGGIDSSLVAKILKENLDEVHAFTLGFKGRPIDDERERAHKFANENNIIIHEIELSEDDYYNKKDGGLFNEIIKYLDEPLTEVSLMNKFALFRECKKYGFKVVLSGTGGDELFYGYPNRNEEAEKIKIINELAKICIAKKGFKKFRKLLNFYFKNRKIFNKNFCLIDKDKNVIPHLPRMHLYHQELTEIILNEEKYDFKQRNYREKYYNDEKEEIDKVYSYLFNIFLNHCFEFDDKMSMANSVEFRNPLCNKRLIEFLSSLPVEYKYQKDNPKGFLKDVIKGIVPDYILNAKKNGLQVQGNLLDKLLKENSKPKILNYKPTTYGEILLDRFLYEKKKTFLKDSIWN